MLPPGGVRFLKKVKIPGLCALALSAILTFLKPVLNFQNSHPIRIYVNDGSFQLLSPSYTRTFAFAVRVVHAPTRADSTPIYGRVKQGDGYYYLLTDTVTKSTRTSFVVRGA